MTLYAKAVVQFRNLLEHSEH